MTRCKILLRWILFCITLLLLAMPAGCASAPGNPSAVTLTPEQIQSDGNLVLVNAAHLWPENYEPESLISLIEERPQGLVGLRDGSLTAQPEAFQALVSMLEAAKEAGYTGYIVLSAYRSYEQQAQLYQEEQQDWLSGLFSSGSQTAAPGASEHHTGLAFDLGVMEGDQLISGFGDTPQGQWVNAHCADFGFIQRYAEDKQDITGIIDEPWHYRYVGIEAAQAMTASGECLEEYLNMVD